MSNFFYDKYVKFGFLYLTMQFIGFIAFSYIFANDLFFLLIATIGYAIMQTALIISCVAYVSYKIEKEKENE